jgi:hypothetical protein
MAKAKNYRIKKPTECPCLNGWVCEDHPNQPWKHRGCGAAGELCKNPQCDKEPDSVFVLGQPEEENRQLEKLELPERRRFMRLSDSTRPIIFGFILAIGITLIQPYLAAGQSFGRSGTSGAFRMQGQRPFNRFGFFGVDGLGDQGDQQVIIIQQSPPAPTAKPSEPAENRIYVQPRWVDGGYGVQVLEPGYWTVPK